MKLLLQPRQAVLQKCQTELRVPCALQPSVGNFVERNISLGKKCLRWSWNSVWARKSSTGLCVCLLFCCLYVPHLSWGRMETNKASERQTQRHLCVPESCSEPCRQHSFDTFLFVRWANMQTVIKLRVNWNLGKVRPTRINQPGLNHPPVFVYVKIKPAFAQICIFCYHLVSFYLGVID